MVKTTESTTLLENNSSPNCLSQASDYDGNGFKNNQIKTQNGGTTSSELQTTSTNDYSTIVVPPSSSTTGHLTVEKYILQLQQKDERINTLKEENKRLRSTLISKTSEFQNRVDELVAELERQDEIVKKLRNDLAICRRTVSNPSTQITLKEPLSKKFSSLSASSSFSLQDSSSFPSNRTTNNSFKDIIEGNSDDICAKLQNFCERNNLGNIQQLQQQQQLPLETRKRRATKSAVSTPIKKQPCLEPLNIYQNANNNNDVDQENQLQQQQNLIPFTEQLCKLIAENPTTLLPAAALIFVSASITQPPPIAEEVEEKIQEEEEEEENIIEEEEQENYKNIKEENETFDQQQQQQTCSVDAETADNFLSFLMESTNGGANNSSTTVPTPCFTSTSSFCDNSQKKQKNNRRNKLRRNSTNNNQIIETPSQKQQNLDFEEVMQRVIGEAMNGTVNNSDNVVIEKQQNVLDQNKHKITTTTTFVSSPIPAEIITTTLPVNKQDYSLLSATHKTQNNDLKLNNLPHHHSSATAKPFTPEEQKLADELEARIDANIIKLGTCPLNPIELAVQCTRLMRDYGIGQRLFARTVMCKVSKSQGSLSELLSKPRPWNKLTDKNRDSFRRIYAWITDDKAIDLLCQLSPRKVAGAEKIIHPDPKTLVELPESVVDGKGETLIVGNKSETKIIENDKKVLRQSSTTNFILKDVKTEIPSLSPIQNNNNLTIKQQLSPNNNLITTTTLLEASSSIDDNNLEKVGEKIGGGGGGGRWRHDDIPREKIIGILEAEKAKLLEIENNNKTTIEFLPQNIITTTTTTTTPNRRGRSATTANIPPTPLEDNNNLINSSSQLLVNELGINTPIGTILKKANSPIPATSSLNGGGKELENKKTHLNKRKTFTPTSINNNNTTTPLIKPEASLLTGSTATSSSSTAKRLPRFQRTIITDRQKEALIFIYIHEQRPNSKLIEQLAAKVGLQARTVNNWFHNHRTRNKEKQIKNDDETGLITTIKSSHSTTPTPTQVLSKALNAADMETAKWFRELAELLHLYSDNTTTNNIQDINYNNIYFNLSALNNNNSKTTSPAPERINNEEDILSNGNSSAISSPTASLTKKNNISQLDRAIARIHSRLSTEGF